MVNDRSILSKDDAHGTHPQQGTGSGRNNSGISAADGIVRSARNRAVFLAGVGMQFFTAAEGVSRFVSCDRVFEPDGKRYAFYAEQTARYRRLFPLLHEFLTSL